MYPQATSLFRSRGGGGGLLHAWDVVTKFYEMKVEPLKHEFHQCTDGTNLPDHHHPHRHLADHQGGAEFNSAPARRLSAAFGLDLAPTTAGNKQVLVGRVWRCFDGSTFIS